MTPQELKNSILQLAIQGKLVEQRPEEGTAAELLEKILAAKNAKGAKKNLTRRRGERGTGEGIQFSHLPKAATTQRQALSASPREKIPDDEKPFDIPESWEWVRLGECSTYADKKEKVLPSEIRPDDWSLDLEDIEKDTGRIVEFRSAGDRHITGDKVVFRKGQILYSKLRPYLKKILVAPKDGICTPELVPFSALGGIDGNYLVIVLKSPHVDFAINSVTYGVKMPRVGTDTMVNLLVPLPPLAEQKRIVAKIEELLPLIARYEKAWSKLEDFNKRFPVDMQKSLLQMAIQGKLVEQRPEEGTAAELLEKILATKNATGAKKNLTRRRGERGAGEGIQISHLPKAATTQRQALSAPSASPREKIPDDEKPFDIPESWEWVRLGDLGNLKNGYAFKSTEYTKDGIQVVRISDLSDDAIGLKDAVFYPQKKELTPYHVVNGSFLICMTGSIGKMAWVKDGVLRYLNQRVGMFIPNALCSSAYLWLCLHTSYVIDGWIRVKTSTNGNIKNSDIMELLVPLPPLAEQERIVAKLEELLPLCERLKGAVKV